jgi:chromosome segregation ATPase
VSSELEQPVWKWVVRTVLTLGAGAVFWALGRFQREHDRSKDKLEQHTARFEVVSNELARLDREVQALRELGFRIEGELKTAIARLEREQEKARIRIHTLIQETAPLWGRKRGKDDEPEPG